MSSLPLVAIDCRFAGGLTGLGRYSRELVSVLVERDDPLRYALIVTPEGQAWAESLKRDGRVSVHPVDIPHYSLAEQLRLPGVLRRLQADLLFALHFNAPFFPGVPTVATVHDLILHRYPNQASPLKQAAYRILLARAVRRARCVIAVSSFVEQEIERTFGASAARHVRVIHEGVSPTFSPRSEEEQHRVRAACNLPASFLLYVGNAKEHKNVPLLIAAHQAAGPACPPLVLVAGGKEAERLSLPDGVRRISSVDEKDLPALYSAATAFVSASLYEGFGLPAVEAIACGCPVIVADRGPAAEVTRGQAMLIEPTVEVFAQAMRRPPARPAPTRLWQWEDAAKETARVLREAI